MTRRQGQVMFGAMTTAYAKLDQFLSVDISYARLTWFGRITMETTKLSSKGQVIIPKALRRAHRWEPGLEFLVVDTDDGLLLKPKAPFTRTGLAEVYGMLRGKVVPKTDQEIESALRADMRKKWHGSD